MRGWLGDVCARYGDDVFATLRPRGAEVRAIAEALAVARAEVATMEAAAAARRGPAGVLPGLQALAEGREAGGRRRRRLVRLLRGLDAAWDALGVPPGTRTAAWWAFEAAVPATWSGCLRWQATARAVALVERLQCVATAAYGGAASS